MVSDSESSNDPDHSKYRLAKVKEMENKEKEDAEENQSSGHGVVDATLIKEKGKIISFFGPKGYGFIKPDGPRDQVKNIFYHVICVSFVP